MSFQRGLDATLASHRLSRHTNGITFRLFLSLIATRKWTSGMEERLSTGLDSFHRVCAMCKRLWLFCISQKKEKKRGKSRALQWNHTMTNPIRRDYTSTTLNSAIQKAYNRLSHCMKVSLVCIHLARLQNARCRRLKLSKPFVTSNNERPATSSLQTGE
jgi:hypothetical protein